MVDETLYAPSFLPIYQDVDPLLQIDPIYDAFCDGFDQKACDDHNKWLSSSENRFSLKVQATEDGAAGSSKSVAEVEVAEGGGGECVMADEDGKKGLLEIQEGEQGSVEGEEGEKELMEDHEGKKGLNEEEEAITKVLMEETEGREWLMENSEAKQECLEHKAAPLTEETSKADNPRKGAMADRATETQTFLESIRQKSECRLRILKEEEEEALVEDILLKPDLLTEEAEGEGSSTSSCISTAFDYVGEDALRMAEIDEKLEQFIEIHSACGTPSLASVSLSFSKLHNASILNNRNVRSPSIESGATARTEDQRASSISSSIEDYLLERKQSREHQAKVENIDKRLRELMAIGDAPVKLSKEELDALVAQCIKEQNLELSMRPFLCIKTS